MSNRAWVTLATNDSYGLGALVLAHSLRRAGSAYPAVVLITPSVTEAMRDRLRAVFAEVVIVDVLDSKDATHLALLQRPELGITFTKLHCWSLTQYEKCVFLDADTLIVQNCDELFEREELSAAPDVGWPDCFNSGVFVFKPSAETFDSLVKFAQERGSFDGGDQGLLNSYFSDWAHGDINKHLPFLYNVTSAAFYSYIPALKHYGQNLKIIHFIGAAKPWLQQFNWETRTAEGPQHLREFLQLWWDIFVGDVHSVLDISMTGVAGNLARVVLGAGGQREALDDLTRRQGWEAGNIDYMGADAFENIWAKISQTLSQPRVSPPKQSTPPPQVVEAAASAPVEVAQPIPESPVAQAPAEPPAPSAAIATELLDSSVASESPVLEQTSEVAKIEAPLEAPILESPQITEVPPAKVPEPVKSSEPVSVEPAQTPAATPAAPVSAKVVAAVPMEEPKVAAPAEAPSADIPAVPIQLPSTVPSDTAESKPVESKPAEPKPAESKPTESKPAESKPAEAKPAEPKPAEPKPVEPKPAEPKPAEPKPAEPKPAEPKLAEPKPVEPKPAEVAPATPSKIVSTPAQAPIATATVPSTPVTAKAEVTPEKGASTTDSPPLANTPSKEDVPLVSAAKSEERRKPAGKLQLHPPAAADPLPTPDSELEDAAALAHAIIASEQQLHTPTVTSPSPPADPASPALSPFVDQRLSVEEPELPTPPVGAVSLSQIGVNPPPKAKSTTAAQIESSVTEAAADAPKKKVVKKVLKKEGATGGEAPVPPPRKKEKKPKDK